MPAESVDVEITGETILLVQAKLRELSVPSEELRMVLLWLVAHQMAKSGVALATILQWSKALLEEGYKEGCAERLRLAQGGGAS